MQEQQRTALVTGGSGFIGSEVIRQLLLQKIRVKALLRTTSSLSNLNNLNYDRCSGHLGDQKSLENAVANVDYVFHIAGCLNAKTYNDYHVHNVEGTRLLAEAVKKAAPGLKRFIYVSSLAASGPAYTKKPKTEQDADEPLSDYGKSKLGGETALREVSSEGKIFPITIVRPPAVYGPRDRAILEFIKMVKLGIVPLFPGKGPSLEKAYSLIHVEDLVYGIVLAGLSPNQSEKEIFFMCEDGVYTWGAITSAMSDILGKKTVKIPLPEFILKSICYFSNFGNSQFPLNFDKLKELKQDYWICSNNYAQKKLGFKTKWTLLSGMRNTIDWYRQNKWL